MQKKELCRKPRPPRKLQALPLPPHPSFRETKFCPLTPVHGKEGNQGQGDQPQIHSHAACELCDRSQVWAGLTVRLGPIYCADPHPYLICDQLAATVSPQVNLFILTPGKGLLKAQGWLCGDRTTLGPGAS